MEDNPSLKLMAFLVTPPLVVLAAVDILLMPLSNNWDFRLLHISIDAVFLFDLSPLLIKLFQQCPECEAVSKI